MNRQAPDIVREMPERSVIPVERVEHAILVLRGHRVLLDVDLARMYGVETRRLNEQVRRNLDRFPGDFMFQLTEEEFANLKSHFATSSRGWGGKRKRPFAFTEHGAIMAASVLNSASAIQMSVVVVRAFVRLRQIVADHRQLAVRLNELERKYGSHDAQIAELLSAVRELMTARVRPKRRIGFHS